MSATVKVLANSGSALLHAITPVQIPHVQINIKNERAKALNAQRLALMEQPSSSNDITLIALACLAKRHGDPAPGGLTIPSSGMGLLGGRKSVRSETKNKLQELREGLTDIHERIAALKLEITETEKNMAQAQEGSDEHRGLATKLETQKSRLHVQETNANGLQALITRLEQELNPVPR